MKLVLDNGEEIPIKMIDPKVVQMIITNMEALIETNEQWIATKERETETMRKYVFNLRREYDAIVAVKDALERHNEKLEELAKSCTGLNKQGDPENVKE